MMPDAVAHRVRFTGLTLEEALPLASTHPAAYLDETPVGTLALDWDSEAGRLHVEGARA
jgi:N-acetylglucosamine-6-phosphate deacetylase